MRLSTLLILPLSLLTTMYFVSETKIDETCLITSDYYMVCKEFYFGKDRCFIHDDYTFSVDCKIFNDVAKGKNATLENIRPFHEY